MRKNTKKHLSVLIILLLGFAFLVILPVNYIRAENNEIKEYDYSKVIKTFNPETIGKSNIYEIDLKGMKDGDTYDVC